MKRRYINVDRYYYYYQYYYYRWAGLISPLKSSHFEKSSILLTRFLVCCTSDQVTVDAFGNLSGYMRVINEEMYFHFIGEVFLYSFLRIFRVYLWLHMRISSSISINAQGSYRGLAVTSSTDGRHIGGISLRRAGRSNGNNVRKRPKIGHLLGPIETFQCI
jgi:hypothetical protein